MIHLIINQEDYDKCEVVQTALAEIKSVEKYWMIDEIHHLKDGSIAYTKHGMISSINFPNGDIYAAFLDEYNEKNIIEKFKTMNPTTAAILYNFVESHNWDEYFGDK